MAFAELEELVTDLIEDVHRQEDEVRDLLAINTRKDKIIAGLQEQVRAAEEKIRHLDAKKLADEEVDDDGLTELYVPDVPIDTEKEDIKAIFELIAHVLNVRVRVDPNGRYGRPHHFAFVLFASKSDAEKVLMSNLYWTDGDVVKKQLAKQKSYHCNRN